MNGEIEKKTPQDDNLAVDIVGWLGEAWRIFKKDPVSYAVTALIFIIVLMLSHFIPWVGGILVGGPMIVGLYLVIGDRMEGKDFNAGRIFDGFKYFVPAVLANLLITVFSTMGLILFILPGIVIGSWYLFTFLFIIDRDMEFWPAMEASRQTAFKDIIGFTFFQITLLVINALGFLLFAVGLLVTVPLSALAVFVAYNRLVGVEKLSAPGKGPQGEIIA